MKGLIFILSVFSITFLSAQNNTFPNSYIGNWQGKLEIYGVNSINMKVDMSLDIQPTKNDSLYAWTITYFINDTLTDIRNYELIVIDHNLGLYAIDENNGIRMESYFLHHTFTTYFSVMENNLIFSYTLENENLIIDVFFSPKNAISQTGGNTINGEDIPIVKTFEVSGRQRAILTKK